ncbi:MAG TPA: DUF6797 domain-containing protein, partial [Planctomycetota bacterium]|nr:DUF6797 domain-containing protein [Planctomycetota bacterium]
MRIVLLVTLLGAPVQEKKRAPSMDYGPFLCASFVLKPDAKFDNSTGHFDGPSVARGVAVRLADDWSAGAIFDMDTLRWAGGWKGGALKFRGVIFDGSHGPCPTLGVPPAFVSPAGPGWARNGSFTDPRPDSIAPLPRPGPLPKEWAKYKGLYVHGRQVVLHYSVGKTDVLDSIALEGEAFARTLRVEASTAELELLVADPSGGLTITTVDPPPGLSHVSTGGTS